MGWEKGMNETSFSLQNWPRTILSGNASFASCEEVIHPELRGKPISMWGELGIVACVS
jgi:hypothetical protein